MSTAIGIWPDHQIRPGAAPESCDCNRYIGAGSNEHSNRYVTGFPRNRSGGVPEDTDYCPKSGGFPLVLAGWPELLTSAPGGVRSGTDRTL